AQAGRANDLVTPRGGDQYADRRTAPRLRLASERPDGGPEPELVERRRSALQGEAPDGLQAPHGRRAQALPLGPGGVPVGGTEAVEPEDDRLERLPHVLVELGGDAGPFLILSAQGR